MSVVWFFSAVCAALGVVVAFVLIVRAEWAFQDIHAVITGFGIAAVPFIFAFALEKAVRTRGQEQKAARSAAEAAAKVRQERQGNREELRGQREEELARRRELGRNPRANAGEGE